MINRKENYNKIILHLFEIDDLIIKINTATTDKEYNSLLCELIKKDKVFTEYLQTKVVF